MGWWGYSIKDSDNYYSLIDRFLSVFDSHICKNSKIKMDLTYGTMSWNDSDVLNKAIENIPLVTKIIIHQKFCQIKNKKKCESEISDDVVEKCLYFEAIAIFINEQPKIEIEKCHFGLFTKAFHILKKSSHTAEYDSPSSRRKTLDKTLALLKTKVV